MTSDDNASVGIFWLIAEKGRSFLLTDKIKYSQAESYGDALTWGGHYEFWEQLRKNHKNNVPLWSEYEEWPRGRVIYNTKNHNFIAYADKKLFTKSGKKLLINEFCLPNANTIFLADSHYISFRNPTIPM